MKIVPYEKMTQMQVGALKECIDFSKNGYREIVSYISDSSWFIKYRHLRNGSTIIVRWAQDYYYIEKNGTVVKSLGRAL